MFFSRRRYRKRRRGSGVIRFVVRVGFLCCLLLIVNAAICQLLCVFLRSALPSVFADLRVIQAVMFFGPIFMIGVEFWVYDRRVDYLSRRHQQVDTEATGFIDPATEKNQ